MRSLTVDHVCQLLARQLESRLRYRLEAPGSVDDGALIDPKTGLIEANETVAAPVVFAAAVLHLAGWCDPQGRPWPQRVAPVLEALIREQRESGCIDLPSCNIDAEPDTAFILLQFCAVEELARHVEAASGAGAAGAGGDGDAEVAWAALRERMLYFVRRAVAGVARGGFHTPNHRWVIAAALSWAGALWPELDSEATVKPLLDEGYDIDADGFFIERSSGGYDAVNVRCLWRLHLLRGDASAKQAALANLETNLHMLHADGTIETALSTRQDRGVSLVPDGLIDGYLMAAHCEQGRDDAGRWFAAAEHLWQAGTPRPGNTPWIAFTLMRYEPAEGAATAVRATDVLPQRYTRVFAGQKLTRRREGLLSVSVMAERPLLTFHYGEAALVGLHVRHCYFGAAGDFLPSGMDVIDGENGAAGVQLTATGREGDRRRPAYEKALGRAVVHAKWEQALAERTQRPMPPAAAVLTVRWVEDGLSLSLHSTRAPAGVLVQLAFDFAPGGHWQGSDCALVPAAGQVMHLRHGRAVMRYGPDAIELDGGAAGHDWLTVRDGTTWPQGPRVVVNLRTPVEHTMTLRGFRGYRR